MRILVTGGVRSGKSALAESFLPQGEVTYVATGPRADDSDWAARIAAHRQRRSTSWRTIETQSLAVALRDAEGAVLVDCLGTWVTALLDAHEAWDAPREQWQQSVRAAYDGVVTALENRSSTTVLVTNEVGWGIVSEHRSGRVFADELGVLNQRVARVCDRVVLAVAGYGVAVKP